MKISVVVPVYNTVRYLKKCIDSIVKQSFIDFQIILVDDGSTDGSERICDEYAKADSRIKVIHQTNSGVVRARKTGLKAADGDYIYYVDSDDWIDENIIKSFMDILLQYSVNMVLIDNKREYENGNSFISMLPFEEGLYGQEWIKSVMIGQLMRTDVFFASSDRAAYWNYLIDKKILLKNQKNISDQIRIWDDVVVTYPCLLDSSHIYIKKEVYYHYRQRSDSLKRIRDSREYGRLQLVYSLLVRRFVTEAKRETLLKQAKYILLYSILFAVPEKMQVTGGLFPYQKFPPNSRVVIYGAGGFGKNIVEILNKTRYANIIAWVDKSFAIYKEEGIKVDSPDMLYQIEYDYIILGVLIAGVREDIKKILITKYHISEEKIIDIDMNMINNTSLPIEFQNILNEVQNEMI
jgi:glycosyltransferase involved in cell wall biosynthesis